MMRWFPRLKVVTTCFSCSPPDLNALDPCFIFMYTHYDHCHRATAHLQLNYYYYYYYYISCGRYVTLQLDEGTIIFIHCTQFLTTDWCDITQGAAITDGMATSFGMGALGFDSQQGQGLFCPSKGSDSLWGPHCSLLSGYQGFCFGGNAAGAWS
jgi:hypothetical protein